MSQIPFPISFWAGPPHNLERFQEIADCGFTVVPVRAETPEQGCQALALAEQVGIAAIVWDPRIHRDLPDTPDWERTVQKVVDDYAEHPALWGYFITDEPHLTDFSNLARLTQAFLTRDPERVPYINLFPNYASPDQLGTIDYAHHVRAYLETVRPPLLSYDHYALLEDGNRPEYFPNLETIRDEALRARVPFWNIVLATPHFNYRDPSPADMRWQVYTTLAYGGKGLAYFTYWTPDAENYRNGIVGPYGHRTTKYDVVRQLNLEMQHLGLHLLGLTSTGVYHWPDAPQGATVLPGDGLVAGIKGGEFVVGEFADGQGLPWLMVVNRNREHAAMVTLRLRTRYPVLKEVARTSGELRPVSRDQNAKAEREYADGLIARFWLAPADGRLLRLGGAD